MPLASENRYDLSHVSDDINKSSMFTSRWSFLDDMNKSSIGYPSHPWSQAEVDWNCHPDIKVPSMRIESV